MRADQFFTVGPPVPLTLPSGQATGTLEQGGFPVADTVDGTVATGNGWAFSGVNSTQSAVWQTAGPQSSGSEGSRLTFTMDSPRTDRHTLGHFRWYGTTDANPNAGNIGSTNWVELTPISATGTSGEDWLISPDSDAFGDFSANRVLWDPTQGAPGSSGPAELLTVVADLPSSLNGLTGLRLEAIYSPGIFSGSGDLGGPGLTSGNGNIVLSELSVVSQSLSPPPLTPEPASLALMGLAIGSVFAGYWRRQKRLGSVQV